MTKTEAKKKVLENRKVRIQYIEEKFNSHYTSIDKKHVGRSKFPGCGERFVVPLSSKHNGLLRFLDSEEQKAFEVLLDMEEGALSFHNPKGKNYWHNFKVKVESEGLTLDLSDIIQNLQYRVLKIQSTVSPDYDLRSTRGEYKWMIVDENQKVKSSSDVTKIKMKAYGALDRIKDNKFKLSNIAIVLGIFPPKTADEDWYMGEFSRFIENTSKSATETNVHDFLKAFEDEKLVSKAMFERARKIGEIVHKGGGKYETKNKTIIGNSKTEALEWWDNPENQITRKTIEEAVKANG